MGQVFGAMFLAIVAGFVACIVVELAFGRGSAGQRAAIGVGFALLDAVLFLAFMQVVIRIGIASGPSQSASGPLPVVLFCLAAWIVPVWRAWWLKRPPPAS